MNELIHFSKTHVYEFTSQITFVISPENGIMSSINMDFWSKVFLFFFPRFKYMQDKLI